MNGFELEFTRIGSSGLCHYIPPLVVVYTILAYYSIHFFGGTSHLRIAK
jgi:hypothetical protein